MAHTPRNLAWLIGTMIFGATFAASAADPGPTPELISGARAQMLAGTCFGCHGTDGLSAGPATPIIAGINGEYFTEVMQGFQEGTVYSTVMGRIAKGYTEEEIKLLASYFSGKPYQAATQEFDPALAEKGAKLHHKFCEKCHSEGGKPIAGEDEDYQLLAGQWTPYLHNTMSDIRAGRREIPKKMKSRLDDLLATAGDGGIQALFAYYASEKLRTDEETR